MTYLHLLGMERLDLGLRAFGLRGSIHLGLNSCLELADLELPGRDLEVDAPSLPSRNLAVSEDSIKIDELQIAE